MTLREKKMKAAAIAVTYCLLNETEEVDNCQDTAWRKTGMKTSMDGREFIQRKDGDSRFSK